MFRGFDVKQVRWVLGLLAVFFGALVYVQHREEPVLAPVVVHGAVEPTRKTPAPTPVLAPPRFGEIAAPAPPTPAPESSSPSPAGPDGLIDLNSATVADLELLPGIGPTKATAILNDRLRHGPFSRVEDLERVPGIGPKTVEQLRPLVLVSGAAPAPGAAPGSAVPAPEMGSAVVRINVASETELQALKYVGPAIARRIVEDRQKNGPYRSLGDLQRVKGIGPRMVEANSGRIRFD